MNRSAELLCSVPICCVLVQTAKLPLDCFGHQAFVLGQWWCNQVTHSMLSRESSLYRPTLGMQQGETLPNRFLPIRTRPSVLEGIKRPQESNGSHDTRSAVHDTSRKEKRSRVPRPKGVLPGSLTRTAAATVQLPTAAANSKGGSKAKHVHGKFMPACMPWIRM
jgi:hypothetical protein